MNDAAVHAVAGKRSHYQPIEWCGHSPLRLAEHYWQLGVSRLYVADLDAILHGKVQTNLLVDIANQFPVDELLLDIGWKGACDSQIAAVEKLLQETGKSTCFIAATESARDTDAIDELAKLADPSRVFLSLDLRGGKTVDNTAPESEWIETAIRLNLAGVIVLDIAAVGTGAGPVTADRCRTIANTLGGPISRQSKHQRIYSGGGVRTLADVAALVDAGCHGCLVGTMLHESEVRAT
ncbi:1-(5-phosphoribosyl)-5-[(5-phosphoribosylamino)methylideneamino] imidazole-4-carboxamide isomerase [Rubripirellula reticaptiva]|uniref:1-(5-phosphoribosyl)-5-[(5-phosphoribosylamino)methylideneamino] imidazole-4-carboxamide isomerase n=2 Tax=Rubripirellula reticaptiva TaxID=2528013 RepID=A0A5C6F1S1_9BACT|nr:1-(5-phosphoribosyl)-5-[(5-phosphoribosylamino)methylideneamino] imidazole-4-carboxamide isomerase [Rubripirellula reticaptiva]